MTADFSNILHHKRMCVYCVLFSTTNTHSCDQVRVGGAGVNPLPMVFWASLCPVMAQAAQPKPQKWHGHSMGNRKY